MPEAHRTSRLHLRPLRAADARLDHEAVMASREHLRRWSQSAWPADGFTVEQNRADLVRHEREHRAGVAFTFTVLAPDGTRCLGCAYLSPLEPHLAGMLAGTTSAACVGFWVRADEIANDLDRHLLGTLRAWLAAEWTFDRVAFVISRRDDRQAAILADAGLAPRPCTLADGRACWLFA